MRPPLVAAVGTPDAWRGEWEDLAERVGASPFLRPGWTEAWFRAFGRGRLEVHAVRRDGRPAALVPLVRRGGVLASPTNWHSAEFGLLAEDAEAARALAEALPAAAGRRLSLAFLDGDAAQHLADAARRQGRRVLRRTQQRAPTVALEGDWEAYLAARSRNLRGDLARRRRALAARGRVALEVTGAEDLEARLAEGFTLEASGWKGARRTAMSSRPEVRAFYAEVARWAAARGWLRLAFLRLDGVPLAFDLALEQGGVHWMLKTGFSEAHRELGPGKVLRGEMIARAFRAGLRSYELLGDAEPWKLQWASRTRARELVQAFRSTPLGLCDWTLVCYGRPLAKGLRDRLRGAAAPGEARSRA